MARKIFDATLTQAQLQALVANHYFWIDKNGNLFDTGQSTLSANVSVPTPTDLAWIEVSRDLAAELIVQHGVLTGAAGGKVSWAPLTPDVIPPAGAPLVVGATVDQALATTAESVITPVVNPPTTVRTSKAALALLFTTVPVTASIMRLTVWSHRDGDPRVSI